MLPGLGDPATQNVRLQAKTKAPLGLSLAQADLSGLEPFPAQPKSAMRARCFACLALERSRTCSRRGRTVARGVECQEWCLAGDGAQRGNAVGVGVATRPEATIQGLQNSRLPFTLVPTRQPDSDSIRHGVCQNLDAVKILTLSEVLGTSQGQRQGQGL